MENSLLILLIALIIGLALVKIIIEPLIRMLVGFLKTIIPFLIVIIIGFVALGTQNFLERAESRRASPVEREPAARFTGQEPEYRHLQRERTKPSAERELNDVLRFVDWEE